jgi:hypothetical protein
VWHVSTSLRPGLVLPDEAMRAVCLRALRGVGDQTRGKIEDEREKLSYQVRRRLSEQEEALIPGGACDLRRSEEANRRLRAAWRWLPLIMRDWAIEEITS